MALSCAVRGGRRAWLAGILGSLLAATLLVAAGQKDNSPPADAQQIDLFQGIQNGDLAVRFIPKDSRQGRVTIENKSDKPLTVTLPAAFGVVPILAQNAPATVKLPAAFGAVPILAQAAPAGGQKGGGAMGGGPAMYIAPEKIDEFKVPMVCLEHGKAEPRPTMPYRIVPIEEVTDRPAVKELCRMMGEGKISQRVAQAAAWYLQNDMTWQQLATKQQRRAGGGTSPYFSPAEIHAAMQLAGAAIQAGQAHKPAGNGDSPGNTAAAK
jgi:hypothetical protein